MINHDISRFIMTSHHPIWRGKVSIGVKIDPFGTLSNDYFLRTLTKIKSLLGKLARNSKSNLILSLVDFMTIVPLII